MVWRDRKSMLFTKFSSIMIDRMNGSSVTEGKQQLQLEQEQTEDKRNDIITLPAD